MQSCRQTDRQTDSLRHIRVLVHRQTDRHQTLYEYEYEYCKTPCSSASAPSSRLVARLLVRPNSAHLALATSTVRVRVCWSGGVTSGVRTHLIATRTYFLQDLEEQKRTKYKINGTATTAIVLVPTRTPGDTQQRGGRVSSASPHLVTTPPARQQVLMAATVGS